MIYKELVVIGGGPAGLSAAIQAYEEGVQDILLIERDFELGGILKQCIHNGFGLHIFQEELTGPEYAERFIKELKKMNIEVILDTMVLEITNEKKIIAVNKELGILNIQTQAIILAMGCRERTRGALNIPGFRPAGIFTAGTAQRFVNIEGYMPGKDIVILGSGDIGLIMARRFTLEGAKVRCVVELMPYSNGLTRNVVQCLEDYDIPLYLRHTVIEIHGKDRLEGVTVAEVDDNNLPILATATYIPCDTLLLSVGLIPENELSKLAEVKLDYRTGGPIVNQRMETSTQGIFACGNVLHVHDLVDFVTQEARLAGKGAADYLSKGKVDNYADAIPVRVLKGVRYIVPQYFQGKEMLNGRQELFMRSVKPMDKAKLIIDSDKGVIKTKTLNYVKPSEMINVALQKEELCQANPNYLEISLQEVGDRS